MDDRAWHNDAMLNKKIDQIGNDLSYPNKEEEFVITNQLVKEVISLPMHTELDDEQIAFITSTVISFVNA